MNMYELELNDSNNLALQPDSINIKLKPHQLTSVYKAIDMERNGFINYRIRNFHSNVKIFSENSNIVASDEYTDIKIGTNIGILGDTVGYGKTLIALSIVASNKLDDIYVNPIFMKNYNSNFIYNYLNVSVSNNLVYRNNEMINTTLIIVPRGPVYMQWEKTIKENTNLRLLSITNLNYIKANLPAFNGVNRDEIYKYFERYDIVLIKNTTLKMMIDNYYNMYLMKSWKRIMIDEAHDIIHKIPQHFNYHYMWLISGTYTDILKRNYCVYTKGINDIFNESSVNLVLVKNNSKFTKNSFMIPEPIEKTYLCKLPPKYLIAKRYLNNAILEKINANDFIGAIKELGGKNETEDNIIELVSKELKRELFNLEREREFYINQDIPEEDKQLKLKNINIKIENQNNKINDLTDRIKDISSNSCVICMDNVKNPVMLECTHLYCGKCIFEWIQRNNASNCPYCRMQITSFDKLTAIVDNKEKEDEPMEDDILTKEDRLLMIIKKKPDGKFLIFTKIDNGFELSKKKMDENGIKYEFLKGNTAHMMNVLDRFKNGKLNVILLNTQYAGSGIDINYATDVIIFHSMGIDKQQAIGRAQRVGRNKVLYIHNLCYEDEI